MHKLPKSIDKLITQLSQLPGVGPKTASRLVFYLIRNNNIDTKDLGEAFINLKADLQYCDSCHHITDKTTCDICTDRGRDASLLCVVEEPLDVIALDKAGYLGKYHVLGGQISPLNGIGPKDLHIEDLITRLKDEPEILEVIIATNPNVEGEATATYIMRLLSDSDIKVSRIARGLPMGGDLEYADELTLSRSLEGRNEVLKMR
jgi:recombination protein RecR